jgi:hypothetical protein
MSDPSLPESAKLLIGIMYKDIELFDSAKEILIKKFGEIDRESVHFDFNYTDYYEKEMGLGLKKVFLVFEKPIDKEDLVKIKLYANNIEKRLSKKNNRLINIDPGYITKHQVIVASCKERPHRIYLSKGVYAHLMFFFTKNDVISFKWTFPDYLDNKNFFLESRKFM